MAATTVESLRQDKKVEAHAINSVVPLVEVETLLHSEHSGQLNLCQHNALWHCLDEAVIQNLFWLCEYLLGIERPRFVTADGRCPFLLE